MEYIYCISIGYIIGSFPTAFILIKIFYKKNILAEGSGSSGSRNAFRVSGSKIIGLLVFVIDISKGIVPILIVKTLFNYTFELLAITSIFAVLGHCYSVWLKFNGGKGIATAAGSMSVIAPLVLAIWGIIWLTGFAYKRNIRLATIAASILSAALCFSSVNILIKYSHPSPSSHIYFSISLSIIFFIILVQHYKTIINYFFR